MAEVETAIALSRAAASTNDALLKAQARVWASDVALSVPIRLLKLFGASDVLAPDEFHRLKARADFCGTFALQSGRLADMDLIARSITGPRA